MKHLRYVTALLAAAFTVVAASAQDAGEGLPEAAANLGNM